MDGSLRWGLSFIVVLGLHAGGALALLDWRIPPDAPAAAPAVLLELEPVVSAGVPEISDAPAQPRKDAAESPPPEKPVEAPQIELEALARQLPAPDPPEPVTLPQPDRLAEPVPLPEAPSEAVIPRTPPEAAPPRPPPAVRPKAAEKPVPRKPEPERKPKPAQTTAPAAAAASPPAAAAPPAVVTQPSPEAVRRWQATLAGHLQRHKRYPSLARNNGAEGIAYLRFTMDRHGRVLAKNLDRASGHSALDRETLDLIERAQPLPPPPADMPGQQFEFVVPVQFQLR